MRPVENVLETTLRDLMVESSGAEDFARRVGPFQTYDSVRSTKLVILLVAPTFICAVLALLLALFAGVRSSFVFRVLMVSILSLVFLTAVFFGLVRPSWRFLGRSLSKAWERFLFPNVN